MLDSSSPEAPVALICTDVDLHDSVWRSIWWAITYRVETLHPGQRSYSTCGIAPSYAPAESLTAELEALQNARSRTHEATADVNLGADWPTFREQLARLEELLLSEPERPMPPPPVYGGAFWFSPFI